MFTNVHNILQFTDRRRYNYCACRVGVRYPQLFFICLKNKKESQRSGTWSENSTRFELEMCGNRFIVPNPSHFSEFIPIPITFPFPSETKIPLSFFPSSTSQLPPIPIHIRQLNRDICVFMKNCFLRTACLRWPPTNSVRQIRESKRTDDQMNWHQAKKINVSRVVTVFTDFLPLQRLNNSHSWTLFPFPFMGDRIPITVGIPWDPWDPGLSHSRAQI